MEYQTCKIKKGGPQKKCTSYWTKKVVRVCNYREVEEKFKKWRRRGGAATRKQSSSILVFVYRVSALPSPLSNFFFLEKTLKSQFSMSGSCDPTRFPSVLLHATELYDTPPYHDSCDTETIQPIHLRFKAVFDSAIRFVFDSPMISNCKLAKYGANYMDTPTLYKSVVGALQYATITSSVSKVCQFLAQPLEEHWKAVKRILRYLQGTASYGLLLKPALGLWQQSHFLCKHSVMLIGGKT